MRKILIFVLFIALLQAISAEPTLVAPDVGATTSGKTDFTFITYIGEQISDCSLYIDNTKVKTSVFGDVIRGKTITMSYLPAPGKHEWKISCAGEKEIFSSETRTFTAQEATETPVKVTPSGVFRGSFVHEFT